MPKLLICEDGDPGCFQCFDCPCAVPHYEDVCRKARCMGCECRLIDEEQRLEAEAEWSEYDPWKCLKDYDFLEQLGATGQKMFESLYLNKFCKPGPLWQKDKSQTIKFRRYANPEPQPINHMIDAYLYGTGVCKDGQTKTKDFLQKEATGRKDTDSTTIKGAW